MQRELRDDFQMTLQNMLILTDDGIDDSADAIPVRPYTMGRC